MKRMLFCWIILMGLLTSCSHCVLRSGGFGDVDSIHVEYTGMGGTTRFVINHSDTLTILKGVFFHDSLGNDSYVLFEPVKKLAPNDVLVIKSLVRQLFVERSEPDTLWVKPYKYGATDMPILSVHVFKKGKEGAYYYDTGEEKNGIVYSTSTRLSTHLPFLSLHIGWISASKRRKKRNEKEETGK